MSICKRENFPDLINYFDEYSLNQSLCPIMDGKEIEGGFLSDY